MQVVRQTQRVVDGGVEAGGEHLPAAHRAVLDTLATSPRALAPTARLPPEDAIRVTTVSFHTQIFSRNEEIFSADTLEDIPSRCRTRVWAQVCSASRSRCRLPRFRRSAHKGRS